jgi:hypothetical protein
MRKDGTEYGRKLSCHGELEEDKEKNHGGNTKNHLFALRRYRAKVLSLP